MNKIISFIGKNKILSLLVVTAATTTIASGVIKNNNENRGLLNEKINALEAPIVKDELKVEIGRLLPSIDQYFDDTKNLNDDATITYLKDDNEQRINSICKET